MRDYGRVHSSFWTSPTTRAMSEDGRALALYLLTSPHTTMIGCFRAPDGYVSEDLGWCIERVSNAFDELHRLGFATRDGATKWVLLHRFLKWNPIGGGKQGTGAARLFDQIPNDCAVKPWLAKAIDVFAPDIPRERLKAFDALLIQYEELYRFQEQEQEREQEPLPASESVQDRALGVGLDEATVTH